MPHVWSPAFHYQDCQLQKNDFLYQGYLPVRAYNFRFRMFEGGFSHEVHRECLIRPPAVAVLLFDPEADTLVLIEQVRVGALAALESEQMEENLNQNSPWLLEIVAGVIDEGETPESTAHRETEEEAGLKVQRLFPICRYLVSPGISSEVIHIFCGIVKAPKHGGTFHGLKEDGEDIKLHILKSDEALALLQAGKILSSPSVIAIQWFALNRHNTTLFK